MTAKSDKCKYIFMFPHKDSVCKGLKGAQNPKDFTMSSYLLCCNAFYMNQIYNIS